MKKLFHSNDPFNYLLFEKDYAMAPIIFEEKVPDESDTPLSQRKIIYDSDSIYNSNIIIVSTESEILRKNEFRKTNITSSYNDINYSF